VIPNNFKRPEKGHQKKKPEGFNRRERGGLEQFEVVTREPKSLLRVLKPHQALQMIESLSLLMRGDSVPIHVVGYQNEQEKLLAVLKIREIVCCRPDLGVKVLFEEPSQSAFRPIIARLKDGEIVPMTFAL
jgi:hypothetical protein